MGKKKVSLIRNFAQWSTSARHKLVIKSRYFIEWLIRLKNAIGIKLMSINTFITNKLDKSEVKPPDKLMSLIFILAWVVYVFVVIWVFWWLRYVTVDSAKWALSAQVQATAAIFGLLIAAVSLLQRRITDQEQQLRNDIYKYLKELAQPLGTPPMPILGIAYGDYLKWITEAKSKKERIAKDAFRNLGRLWVIRFLSLQYHLRLRFGRYLTVGQTKELRKISKLSRESAIDMWEYYYRYPEDFIIKMHETLDMVSAVLMFPRRADSNPGVEGGESAISEEGRLLNNTAYAIVYNDSKVIAENVKRTRLALRPPFYFTSLVLAFAIVLGLCILTGIEGTLLPPILSNPDNLKWVVGIPIGLSIFGIFLCLLMIRKII